MQGSKPWRFTGEEANMDREDIKMLVKKWWDIYNDESLNFKGNDAGEANLLGAALAEAGAVKFVAAPSAA
jgi:inositol 3-alpha-galactosyltransferase